MVLTLFNTLTRRKQPFEPMTPGVVRMFACGPTVYDLSHVGHAKTYTQFDFVARYLRKRGYRVTYAQNITDVDDKIIRRADELGLEPSELAARFEATYHEDMAALHNDSVDIHARAHDYIEQIVAQVQQLIDRGHAYQLDDSWYFDLSTFSDYGKLSGRTEAQAEDSMARVDENAPQAQLRRLRAVEGAQARRAMLGHPAGGGPARVAHRGHRDNRGAVRRAVRPARRCRRPDLPHHEAEIAQMESASDRRPLARYWIHAGLPRVDGAKMAKSANNFVTIRQALELTDFRTLRFAFLSRHYRTSMELNGVTLDNARNARRRVENFASPSGLVEGIIMSSSSSRWPNLADEMLATLTAFLAPYRD